MEYTRNALLFGKIEEDILPEINHKYCFDDIKGLKYENDGWYKIKDIIEKNNIDTIISSKANINIVSRLLWECDCLKQYMLTDTNDPYVEETSNQRANALMWDVIAKRSKTDTYHDENTRSIKQTGWINSFTEQYFSEQEMKEYGDNVVSKVASWCQADSVVLEVGIASGITCFRIAPWVKKYIGIDISKETLELTQKELDCRKIDNVLLMCGEANEIDRLEIGEKPDVVIINSVAQYFPGYNYFIKVIKKLVDSMAQRGIIFVGDVMDLSKRGEFQEKLRLVEKKSNKNDLYYSRQFMNGVPAYIKNITDVEISNKVGTIKNELTLYRYDVIFKVDKDKANRCEYTKYQCVLEQK